MRVLVTGAAGFAGRHLLPCLEAHGHTVLPVESPGRAAPGMQQADVRDAARLDALAQELRPDACIHLAAMAFVPRAWEEPGPAFETNVVGTLNLLSALRRANPSCRVLVVTSAQVYGTHGAEERIAEDHPFAPANMYAISKLAADLAALAFGDHHGMAVMTARPANHIGPGQSEEYVVSAFAAQIVRIAQGAAPPEIRVGNLESRRTFLDVRDVVEAYRLLIEKGRPARAYNIGSSELHRIREVLEELCALAGVHPTVRKDPERFRPTDTSMILDTARITADTGWTTHIPFRDSLKDIFDAARARHLRG